MDEPIRVVQGEVVDAVPSPPAGTVSAHGGAVGGDAGGAGPRTGPPIHALSALLLLAIDNLWNLADWAVLTWFFTIPASFISVFVPVLVIQKALRKDSFGRAFLYALLLAIVAAVPTSVTGTPVGMALLAWTGLSKLLGRPGER
jgi:hypothetical protein